MMSFIGNGFIIIFLCSEFRSRFALLLKFASLIFVCEEVSFCILKIFAFFKVIFKFLYHKILLKFSLLGAFCHFRVFCLLGKSL